MIKRAVEYSSWHSAPMWRLMTPYFGPGKVPTIGITSDAGVTDPVLGRAQHVAACLLTMAAAMYVGRSIWKRIKGTDKDANPVQEIGDSLASTSDAGMLTGKGRESRFIDSEAVRDYIDDYGMSVLPESYQKKYDRMRMGKRSSMAKGAEVPRHLVRFTGSNVGKDATSDSWGPANMFGAVALMAAALLGGTYVFKKMERDQEKRDIDESVKAIEMGQRTLNDVMISRAKNAKGKLTDREFMDSLVRANTVSRLPVSEIAKIASADGMEKTAGGGMFNGGAWDTLGAAVGLIVCATLGLSWYASHRYFEKDDPANLKYKAAKKGLKEYARLKAMQEPLLIQLNDDPAKEAEILRDIDSGKAYKSTLAVPRATRAPRAPRPVPARKVTAADTQTTPLAQAASEPVQRGYDISPEPPKTVPASIRDVPEISSDTLNRPISITL